MTCFSRACRRMAQAFLKQRISFTASLLPPWPATGYPLLPSPNLLYLKHEAGAKGLGRGQGSPSCWEGGVPTAGKLRVQGRRGCFDLWLRGQAAGEGEVAGLVLTCHLACFPDTDLTDFSGWHLEECSGELQPYSLVGVTKGPP